MESSAERIGKTKAITTGEPCDLKASDPVLLIIAGPNGAGKTTFAKQFLPEFGVFEFLNADSIAAGLSPLNPESSALAAGRLLLRRWDTILSQKVSFAVESTLSGKTYNGRIAAAKAAGYAVIIAYLWLPAVKISLQRIRQRVKMGGHRVPDKDVRRRFPISLVHFFDTYQPLSDHAMLWDVSCNPADFIAEWDHRWEQPSVYNSATYEIIQKQLSLFRRE